MSADGNRGPRVPPNDLDAEQAVLGGVILDNRMFYVASATLVAEDFYRQENQVLWRAMAMLAKAGKPLDFVTLCGWLKDGGQLEDAGGVSNVGSIANNTPSAANVEAYAERVKDLSQRRRVIAFASSLQDRAYTSQGADLMGEATQAINGLLNHATGTSKRFSDAFADADVSIREAKKRRASGQTVGAPSGLSALDYVTGGFTGPRLVVVAARPKCGKSALLNQYGIYAATHGYPGLICSLELGADELVIRAMANVAGVNVSRLHRGYDEEIGRGQEAASNLGDIPLWLDCDTMRLEQICAQIALHRHRHGIQWAAVDHLGLVKTEARFNSRNDQIGHISWSLKQLAKQLNMPIIALSQLSRTCDKENRRPRPDDLRDSGNIEQDADMVIMLHVDQNDREKPVKPVQIGVPANRCGPPCWLNTQFDFDGVTQTFKQLGGHP